MYEIIFLLHEVKNKDFIYWVETKSLDRNFAHVNLHDPNKPLDFLPIVFCVARPPSLKM